MKLINNNNDVYQMALCQIICDRFSDCPGSVDASSKEMIAVLNNTDQKQSEQLHIFKRLISSVNNIDTPTGIQFNMSDVIKYINTANKSDAPFGAKVDRLYQDLKSKNGTGNLFVNSLVYPRANKAENQPKKQNQTMKNSV